MIAQAQEAAARCQHGTNARYHGGCRCVPCKAAHSRYVGERRRARANGDFRGVKVPGREVRQYIERLHRSGVTYRQIAARAGVSESSIRRMMAGKPVRQHLARKVAAMDLMAALGGGS